MQNETHSLLIVEPDEKLTHPYNLLPSTYHITRVSTISKALNFIEHTLPSIVILSASFDLEHQVQFLEKVRLETHSHLPKLMFVVNTQNPTNFIPGTSWGGLVQVISTNATAEILMTTLQELEQ